MAACDAREEILRDKTGICGQGREKSGLNNRDAAEAVDAFLDSITDALQGGEEVAFTGFGKFTVQNRAARQGVNPRNPTERVHIPASKVPKFSAGSKLKAAVKSSM